MEKVGIKTKTNYWMLIVVFMIIASIDIWIMFGAEYFKTAFLVTLFTATFIHFFWWTQYKRLGSLISMLTTFVTGLVFLAIILNSKLFVIILTASSGILWLFYYAMIFFKKIGPKS